MPSSSSSSASITSIPCSVPPVTSHVCQVTFKFPGLSSKALSHMSAIFIFSLFPSYFHMNLVFTSQRKYNVYLWLHAFNYSILLPPAFWLTRPQTLPQQRLLYHLSHEWSNLPCIATENGYATLTAWLQGWPSKHMEPSLNRTPTGIPEDRHFVGIWA